MSGITSTRLDHLFEDICVGRISACHLLGDPGYACLVVVHSLLLLVYFVSKGDSQLFFLLDVLLLYNVH